MHRSYLLTPLFLLGLACVPACSDDATSPPPQPATVAPGDAAGSSGGDGADPAATPPASTTPPEPEWVPPVVATTSAACGTPRADAVHADFTTPGGRTFHVWGPSKYDAKKTYPVVIVFHGIQADGAAHESWFKMEDYTNNEAFVVYPDAGGPNAYWDVSGTTDLVFFDQMVKQLGETYCIDPSRVLGFGFSFGGHFADYLGCKRAGYVKAIAVGDGGRGGDAKHCGRLPVLVTTRSHDTNELACYGRSVEASWNALDKCAGPGAKVAQTDPNNGEDMGYCVTHTSCMNPGGVMYCEDTSFDPAWPSDWNHTVREYYRGVVYKWFKALP
jgi:polyhydroxybutyrate depolymerase